MIIHANIYTTLQRLVTLIITVMWSIVIFLQLFLCLLNSQNQDAISSYGCLRDTLPYKNSCEFHEMKDAQSNPDDLMKLLYVIVDYKTKMPNSLTILVFIFRGKVDLSHKEFKNRVIFLVLLSLKKQISMLLV